MSRKRVDTITARIKKLQHKKETCNKCKDALDLDKEINRMRKGLARELVGYVEK